MPCQLTEILDKITSRKDGYDRMRSERVYFEMGRSNIEHYKFEEALNDFGKVVAGPQATPDKRPTLTYGWGKFLIRRRIEPTHLNTTMHLQD